MTLEEYFLSVLDGRATTTDGRTFSITFVEFNGGKGEVALTEEEAALPEDERNAIAFERYNDLRMEMFEKYGFSG